MSCHSCKILGDRIIIVGVLAAVFGIMAGMALLTIFQRQDPRYACVENPSRETTRALRRIAVQVPTDVPDFAPVTITVTAGDLRRADIAYRSAVEAAAGVK